MLITKHPPESLMEALQELLAQAKDVLRTLSAEGTPSPADLVKQKAEVEWLESVIHPVIPGDLSVNEELRTSILAQLEFHEETDRLPSDIVDQVAIISGRAGLLVRAVMSYKYNKTRIDDVLNEATEVSAVTRRMMSNTITRLKSGELGYYWGVDPQGHPLQNHEKRGETEQ